MNLLRRLRDLGWEASVERSWQDVRYALRMLRRSPTFAAVAVMTLGLGIGATTTIYSIVDTSLLQPLPFPHADRLVRVVENVPSRVIGEPPVERGVPYADFLEWQSRSRTLTDTFAVAVNPAMHATRVPYASDPPGRTHGNRRRVARPIRARSEIASDE